MKTISVYENNLLLQKLYKLPLPFKNVETMPEVQYAFFSAEAARQYGSVIWQTPTGEHVECTIVTASEDGQYYKWNDKKFVGEVVSYVSGALCSAKKNGYIGQSIRNDTI